MAFPAVTALYAGVLALMLVALAVRVIGARRQGRVSLGTGGDEALERRVRAHGNFAEYVPMALVLMALAEGAGTAAWMMHGLGVALVGGRWVHAWSLDARSGRGRVVGMTLTFFVLIAAGVRCLAAAVATVLA